MAYLSQNTVMFYLCVCLFLFIIHCASTGTSPPTPQDRRRLEHQPGGPDPPGEEGRGVLQERRPSFPEPASDRRVTSSHRRTRGAHGLQGDRRGAETRSEGTACSIKDFPLISIHTAIELPIYNV